MACPADKNIVDKEAEKISKYAPLKNELHRMWGCEVEVVPVVVGGQGMVTKKMKYWIGRIPGKHSFRLIQKTVLLGSEAIMRKFVSMKN